MKRLSLVVIIALAAITAAGGAFAESRILSLSGIVRVAPPSQPGSEQWTQAAAGQPLPDGTRVMTGDNARVMIEVSPGNTVRLRSNAQIVIGTPRGQVTRFKLITGAIRGVFGRLTGGERFEVEFSSVSAVASVKGTTFEAADGSGGASLRTIFGAIDLILRGVVESIPQGCGMFTGPGGVLQIRPLTDGEVQDGLGQGGGGGDRTELRNFVDALRNAAAETRDVVVEIRENDFAVGRSLRDVHGNLTRVEQRLMRPDPTAIEFINIVSRDSYRYVRHHGDPGFPVYTGPAAPRLDYLLGRVDFNMGLPSNVNEWAGFFSDHQDDLIANHAIVTIANGRVGEASLTISRETRFADNESDAFLLNGQPYIVDDEGAHADGEATDDLWAWAVIMAYGDTNRNGSLDPGEIVPTNRVDIQVEGYALNQDGGILNLGDFTGNALDDPFGFMRTIAGESIFTVAPYDSLGHRAQVVNNIDLVIIPDLAIAIAGQYGASLATVDFGD